MRTCLWDYYVEKKVKFGKPVMVAFFCNMSRTAKNFNVQFYDNNKKKNT